MTVVEGEVMAEQSRPFSELVSVFVAVQSMNMPY